MRVPAAGPTPGYRVSSPVFPTLSASSGWVSAPRRWCAGRDLSGVVEAVGSRVTRFIAATRLRRDHARLVRRVSAFHERATARDPPT